jgi:hypothetical protein
MDCAKIIPGNPEAAITPEWLWLTCRRPALGPLGPTEASTGIGIFFELCTLTAESRYGIEP